MQKSPEFPQDPQQNKLDSELAALLAQSLPGRANFEQIPDQQISRELFEVETMAAMQRVHEAAQRANEAIENYRKKVIGNQE